MISGAMRGKGGRALSAHLLKTENEQVVVINPRGLGSPDLHGQLAELVALSLGGRTDAPCYHVHINPESRLSDNLAARGMWWRLFEAEFGLGQQPYCGAEHIKYGRAHEHRVYSLVRRNGSVVDVGFDFIRREKVSRRVEHAFGLDPVPSKHTRAIERALRGEGHVAVADWLVASGSLDIERPVAVLSPRERLIDERTNVRLADVRAAVFDAWRGSEDGERLRDLLAVSGFRLHAGRAGPVVVDASGTPHLLTRIIGTASRSEGQRVPAAAVRARLAGVVLTQFAEGALPGATRPAAEPQDDGGLGAAGEPRVIIYGPRRRAVLWPWGCLRHDQHRRLEEVDRARERLGNGLAVTDQNGVGILAPPHP